jgi:hypothetical protein
MKNYEPEMTSKFDEPEEPEMTSKFDEPEEPEVVA